MYVGSIQGGPSGRQLHFVDFHLVVLISSKFCQRSCKSCLAEMATQWNFQNKNLTKYIVVADLQCGAANCSPCSGTIISASCEGMLGQKTATVPDYRPRELCKNIQPNMAIDRTPRSVMDHSALNFKLIYCNIARSRTRRIRSWTT